MRIVNLADHPSLVPAVAGWHFSEWGHFDPTGSLESWTRDLAKETRRDRIPTTYVAMEGDKALGSVSLVEHDMLTRSDLSPWVASVFVAEDQRRHGIGSALVRHAVREAAGMGMEQLYLYTHSARDFYAGMGWQFLADDMYEGHMVAIMTLATAAEA